MLSVGYAIYWLWQRQPKTPQEEKVQKVEAVIKSDSQERANSTSPILFPKQDEVLTQKLVKIQGKVESSQRVLVLSNNINDITTANTDGTFEAEAGFDLGINLITVISLNSDFKEDKNITQPIYIAKENTNAPDKFLAGTVAKIFENTITVNSQLGQVNIRMDKNTKLTLSSPTPSKKPQTKSNSSDIRVGDYIIVLGQKNGNTDFTALQIEIYRENKPTINKTYAVVKLTSAAKNNIFSGQNLKDNKLLEFKIDKDSEFIEKDKKTNAKAVVKDKTAIIFYTNQTNGNMVSLVYFL